MEDEEREEGREDWRKRLDEVRKDVERTTDFLFGLQL